VGILVSRGAFPIPGGRGRPGEQLEKTDEYSFYNSDLISRLQTAMWTVGDLVAKRNKSLRER
jgi:hypothetical protein